MRRVRIQNVRIRRGVLKVTLRNGETWDWRVNEIQDYIDNGPNAPVDEFWKEFLADFVQPNIDNLGRFTRKDFSRARITEEQA